MSDYGLRTVCDLDLRDVPAGGEGGVERKLQPGDIIFGRNTQSWISRAIVEFDGYFSHSTLYVGDGQIAHAYTAGVGLLALEDLVPHYPDGLAVARPEATDQQRASAVRWARSLAATSGAGPSAPAYAGRDLGIILALLRRARQAAAERLPELAPDDLEIGPGATPEAFGLGGDDALERFESTCSGFVFRAYAEGAGLVLPIDPAPGLELSDGLIFVEDSGADGRGSLWDHLLADETPLDPADPANITIAQPQALPHPNWRAWKLKAKLLAGAAAGWLDIQDELESGVPLEQVVSPADLWCSSAMTERWFWSEEAKLIAAGVSAGCP